MMVPSPIQAAAVAALDDDVHVREQKERYRTRRSLLMSAVTAAGFRIDDSEAGLYLWITRGEQCWDTVGWFADRGIVVTPGDFYGSAGERHVRMALTATDEAMEQVPGRLG
jgi:aspartate/methionine/tyrosine aminotransferase